MDLVIDCLTFIFNFFGDFFDLSSLYLQFVVDSFESGGDECVEIFEIFARVIHMLAIFYHTDWTEWLDTLHAEVHLFFLMRGAVLLLVM